MWSTRPRKDARAVVIGLKQQAIKNVWICDCFLITLETAGEKIFMVPALLTLDIIAACGARKQQNKYSSSKASKMQMISNLVCFAVSCNH